MKQNLNTKKLFYSLSAASAVLGAAMTSGCCQTRYVYLNADGTPYTPTYNYTPATSTSNRGTGGEIMSGILMGIGQGLSGL